MNLLHPNPDFLKRLLGEISRAKKSVILVNYLATIDEGYADSPVLRLAKALVSAVKRGVSVTVILEGSKFRDNYGFYRILKDGGADVWMDTSLTFIHAKAVTIDDKMLFVGSQNITTLALTSHKEMALETSDKAAIKRFHKELETMTAQRSEISSQVCRKGTSLPATIMTVLISIKKAFMPRAYLFYLLLCREDGGSPCWIAVDYKKWMKEIKLSLADMSDEKCMDELLTLMSRKLRVVEFDAKRNTVKRSPLPRSDEKILIPDTFWKYAWHEKISVGAIHMYLAGEAEKMAGPFAPWWRLERDEIASRYGYQKILVNRAMNELKKTGLVEVLFDRIVAPGRNIRYSNYFRQNPFYDYTERLGRINGLEVKYGKTVFSLARKFADKLYFNSDVEKIEAICRCIRKAGGAKSKKVLEKINRLYAASTKLKFDYAVELFEAKG